MLRRSFLAAGFPAAVRAIQQGRLEEAYALLEKAYESGEVDWISMCVKQGVKRHHFIASKDAMPLTPFLLASITKPMTVTALMTLADSGEVKLSDPVKKFVPEFSGDGRESITLHHCATHTSGLPDMLPENEALRARHAPLSEFVAGTCKTPLLFKPGTECKYQSMGILMIAEVVERVTRTKLRDYLKKRLFDPLGMESASLGLGGRRIADMAGSQVTGNDSWNWNSPYWRDLGAPWGGAHANAVDVVKFLEYFLNPTGGVLKPETARMMIRNQNEGLNQAWGLGWAVRGSGFGKACSPRTFGHSGSTGTLSWADPASGIAFALLTSRPAAESNQTVLHPVSDIVSEAA
jgi:beta-lactamase class C